MTHLQQAAGDQGQVKREVPGASTQGRWNPGKSRAEQGEQACIVLVGFFMIRLVVVAVRAGQKGGIQDRGPEQGSPEQESKNRDVQTSDFLVKEEDEDKEVPGQGQQEEAEGNYSRDPEPGCPDQ